MLPLDRLPCEKIKKDTFIIYNVEPESEPGLHWCLLSVFVLDEGKETCVVHFDSLGIPIVLPQVINFVNLNYTGNLLINKHPLQLRDDTVCGELCILCAHWLRAGKSFDSFLKFYSDASVNASRIKNIFKSVRTRLHLPPGGGGGGGGHGGGEQICAALAKLQ